ncbi:30S ribosomal protein S20 [Candidatus Woesebacteria bacterium]|nr:30S ribosomal protein S20 [Candidatus Woesebacteria bacterium]MBP9819812.1 30S ribosomal protein S20 [Candidatus Woesebacteria bacterium]
MPILANAKKALRSSKRKQVMNNRTRSRLRTMIDGCRTAPTLETLGKAFSSIDIAIKNHIIHDNKGARLKRQLSRLISQA